MGCATLVLKAKGVQDAYLTVKPSINFFQYTYYRYINFSNELSLIQLNETASFGNQTNVKIPKTGHLLSKLYLHIKLPPLVPLSGTYASWSDTIGYSIFNSSIDLLIGGSIVDRLFPVCMDMMDELTTSSNKLGHDFMIGKGDMYRSSIHNADKSLDLMIPLNFWFCKNYGMALPILSMSNQQIQINFKFNDFNKLINYDGNIPPAPVKIISSNIIAEYIFLDDIILKDFQKNKHEYVITQTVYNHDDLISSDKNIFNTKLNFKNPCQELIFACVDKQSLDNNNYFNYSRYTDQEPLVSDIKLLLDGKNRYDVNYLPEFIFRHLFPNNYHSVIPSKHIYVMPFALKPEDSSQPTGSINFGRFDEITLNLKMTPNNGNCYLYVFGIMLNIVRIENGKLSLLWLNNS